MNALRRVALVLPALWLALFVLAPLAIVVRIALSESAVAQPPYAPVLDFALGWDGLVRFLGGLSFDNLGLILGDPLYRAALASSLGMALLATVMLLLIGYPIAYSIARAGSRAQPVLVAAIVLPFLTAFLIRIYAWITILQRDGLLNALLLWLGLIDEPLAMLSTNGAVLLGLVYSYLPFMVLPLYASLQAQDSTLLEAAADLGASRTRTFWSVTVPLSVRGIVAGCLLCFIPITGEFVVPDLLGGSETLMIGQTLWSEFFANRDWPAAAALALVLLLVLLIPILLEQRIAARTGEGR